MDGYGWVLTREVADDDSCGVVLYVGGKRLGEVSHLQTRKKKVAVSFFSCVLFSSAYNSARKIFLLFNLQLTYNEEKKPVLLDPGLFERNGQIHRTF